MEYLAPILSVAALITHVLGVLAAGQAIMHTRTPQGAIAWAACLVVFPYVALPLYWVLGRSRFRGYVEAIRSRARVVEPLMDELTENLDPYWKSSGATHTRLDDIEALAGARFTVGNEVTLLINGDATFDDIIRGIKAAERYVFVQFFIVHDDGLGRRFSDALVERAGAGVRVCFLYDRFGSRGLPRQYLKKLRDAGVEVHAFVTAKGAGNRFQINFRNHRKIVVTDGAVAWVGGHNIGDEYLGLDPALGPFRDTHVRVEGPAALGPQIAFAADWCFVTGEVLDLNISPHAFEDADKAVLSLWSGPAENVDRAELFFAHSIHTAKERVWIASPYFVPTPAVLLALQQAALRGVNVRVITPKFNNHTLAGLAAFAAMQDLDGVGIDFSLHPVGFMHQKVMLIDSTLAVIGTHNFDYRSFRLNFEISMVVEDEGFAERVEEMLRRDLERAESFEPASLAQRPLWFRFAIRVAQLMAPVL